MHSEKQKKNWMKIAQNMQCLRTINIFILKTYNPIRGSYTNMRRKKWFFKKAKSMKIADHTASTMGEMKGEGERIKNRWW